MADRFLTDRSNSGLQTGNIGGPPLHPNTPKSRHSHHMSSPSAIIRHTNTLNNDIIDRPQTLSFMEPVFNSFSFITVMSDGWTGSGCQ
jgi:hypothetical protein